MGTEEKQAFRMMRMVSPRNYTGVERTYYEIVKVVNGVAQTTRPAVRDALKTLGYREIEAAPAVEDVPPPPPPPPGEGEENVDLTPEDGTETPAEAPAQDDAQPPAAEAQETAAEAPAEASDEVPPAAAPKAAAKPQSRRRKK